VPGRPAGASRFAAVSVVPVLARAAEPLARRIGSRWRHAHRTDVADSKQGTKLVDFALARELGYGLSSAFAVFSGCGWRESCLAASALDDWRRAAMPQACTACLVGAGPFRVELADAFQRGSYLCEGGVGLAGVSFGVERGGDVGVERVK
jgi:hypothetical protein